MLRGLKQMCLLTLIMIHEVTWWNISALLPAGLIPVTALQKEKKVFLFATASAVFIRGPQKVHLT